MRNVFHRRLPLSRRSRLALAGALGMGLVLPTGLDAQEPAPRESDRFPGSARIVVDDNEFLVRLECRVQGRPEAGFITEANRITRGETGRSNAVSLRLRPWQDTDDVVVSLEGWVAWMPRPTSVDGVLELTVDMAAVSEMRADGTTVLTTYDMWNAGERPEGRDGIWFEANCAERDPAAPAFGRRGGNP